MQFRTKKEHLYTGKADVNGEVQPPYGNETGPVIDPVRCNRSWDPSGTYMLTPDICLSRVHSTNSFWTLDTCSMARDEVRNSARIGEKGTENTGILPLKGGKRKLVEWNKGKKCLYFCA